MYRLAFAFQILLAVWASSSAFSQFDVNELFHVKLGYSRFEAEGILQLDDEVDSLEDLGLVLTKVRYADTTRYFGVGYWVMDGHALLREKNVQYNLSFLEDEVKGMELSIDFDVKDSTEMFSIYKELNHHLQLQYGLWKEDGMWYLIDHRVDGAYLTETIPSQVRFDFYENIDKDCAFELREVDKDMEFLEVTLAYELHYEPSELSGGSRKMGNDPKVMAYTLTLSMRLEEPHVLGFDPWK